MARQVRRLLRAWRARRLSLTGLSHLKSAVVVGCLLVLGAECALLFAKAIGVTLPGGADVVPGAGRAARVAIVLVYVGLASASAAIALAAKDLTRWRFRFVLLALALPALSLAAETVFDARLEHKLTRAGFFAGNGWWLTLALAAALITAICLAMLEYRPSLSAAAIVAGTTVPFLLCLIAYVFASARPAPLALRHRYGNLPESPRATVALAPANMAAAAGLLLSVVLLWQAAAGARAVVVDAGRRVERLARVVPFALLAALAAKLLWLGLG